MKQVISKIILWITLFLKGAKEFIDKNVGPAIKFLEVIKEAIDNPYLDVVVALTKTDIDDKILQKLRQGIKIALKILIGDLKIDHLSEGDALRYYVDSLRSMTPEMRNAILSKTAGILAKELNGEQGKTMKESDVDLFVQVGYLKHKQENA